MYFHHYLQLPLQWQYSSRGSILLNVEDCHLELKHIHVYLQLEHYLYTYLSGEQHSIALQYLNVHSHNIYWRHTVWAYESICTHAPTCIYIHFYLCVHKSFKGTIYRGASFLESCSKVKTECHNCEKSKKEIQQNSLHTNSPRQFYQG